MGAIELETSEKQIFPNFPLGEDGITDAEAVERWRRAHLGKLEELFQKLVRDLYELNEAFDDYLKLDQTTPQTVENGAPQFDEGIEITEGKRIFLDG